MKHCRLLTSVLTFFDPMSDNNNARLISAESNTPLSSGRNYPMAENKGPNISNMITSKNILDGKLTSDGSSKDASDPASPNDVRMDIMHQSPVADKGSDALIDSGDDDIDNKIRLPLVQCRNLIFELGGLSGDLCRIAASLPMDTSNPFEASVQLRQCFALILWHLLRLCLLTQLDMETCIHKKLELNRQKYPVELCKGKAGKYTQYSSSTGITKHEGQSTLHVKPRMDAKVLFRSTDNLDDAKAALAKQLPDLCDTVRIFAEEREWKQYHTPRNLCIALVGEIGELFELWQFRGDDDESDGAMWELEKYDKLGQEIADVAIYLIRLLTVCNIDLEDDLMKLSSE